MKATDDAGRALWTLYIEDCVERGGQDGMPSFSTYAGEEMEPCEWEEQSEELREWCRERAALLLARLTGATP